jgi:hypothetical protein
MSNLRFNQVFSLLMIISLVSAFIIPPRFTNPARDELEGLFSPISGPVRAIAGLIYRHVHRDTPVDDASPSSPRPQQTIVEENTQLRTAYAALLKKFDDLSQLNADRQLVGDIRPLCRPATVTGTDSSGIRESLIISAGGFGGLDNGMPVLFAHEVVGRIARAGVGSSQVRLITDPGFPLTGRIGQYRTDPDGQIRLNWVEHLQPLVQGIGHGAMAIRSNLSMQQVHDLGIGENDMVLLDDRDWPANLQGYRIGRITSIRPQQNAPLFADIRVEPASDLMRLKEVMVMVKEGSGVRVQGSANAGVSTASSSSSPTPEP